MFRFLTRITTVALAIAFLCPSVSAQETDKSDEGRVYVKVTQNRELLGIPIELANLKVTTSFGEVSIPMEKIVGIKLHVGDDDTAVIAFKNGDLVTGVVKLESLSLKTAWGKAHVNLEQIETITINRNARFIPESGNGSKGWRFSSGVPVTQP